MHLRHHERRIELLELLARELQVERPLADLTQAEPLKLGALSRADPSFEEVRLATLRHLEQLFELFEEVGVVQAVSDELVLPQVPTLCLRSKQLAVAAFSTEGEEVAQPSLNIL